MECATTPQYDGGRYKGFVQFGMRTAQAGKPRVRKGKAIRQGIQPI